jgi:hypothetical protein
MNWLRIAKQIFSPKQKKNHFDYILDESSVLSLQPRQPPPGIIQNKDRWEWASKASRRTITVREPDISLLIEAMIIKPDGSKSKTEEKTVLTLFLHLQVGDHVYMFYRVDQILSGEPTQ